MSGVVFDLALLCKSMIEKLPEIAQIHLMAI